MYRYSIYGLIIESEFEIKVLRPATEEDDDRENVITVSEGDVEEDVLRIVKEADAMEKQYEIGMNISAFFNKGGYYLIREGKEIIVKINEGYDPDTISTWILGFSLSMALLQRGILTIHCSAVVPTDRNAVLISGTPGAGKSSLARKLIESGYKLMADDVAAIRLSGEECMVYSAFPFQKLCRNEVMARGLDLTALEYIKGDKDKFLVPVDDIFVAEPQKLSHMFYIVKAPVKELTVRSLTGFDCFLAIKNNLFLHRLTGLWEQDPEVINMCMKIASKCTIHLVARPDGMDTLGEITDKVKELSST